jgi:4-amino-4-deoxy-L-arabinose transferase-like glycosyltransferase
VLAIWLVLIGRSRLLGTHLLALIVALAIAAPWHLAMWNHYADAFWQAYLGGQVLERVTSDAHGSAPIWYYPLELAKSYWPWLVSAGLALVWGLRHKRAPVPRDLGLLVAVWCGAWLIVPSLAADKTSRYIVSLYPLLAALSGVFLALHGPRVVARALTTAALWGAAIVPAVGVVLLALNVKVHGPASRHWTALLDALREHPDAPVVVTQHSVSLEGTIYLDRRAWPTVADDSLPTPGTLVVDITSADRPREQALQTLPPGAETVLDSPPWLVWRAR